MFSSYVVSDYAMAFLEPVMPRTHTTRVHTLQVSPEIIRSYLKESKTILISEGSNDQKYSEIPIKSEQP